MKIKIKMKSGRIFEFPWTDWKSLEKLITSYEPGTIRYFIVMKG